jgi:hypothetical protein
MNLWQVVWKKIKEWFSKKKPVPIPEPDKPAENAKLQDEANHGFAHSAKVVAEIDLHHINKSGIYFSAQKRKWKVVDGCDGEVHLFVMRDGAWRGYKFDHIRPSSTSRDWKNLNPENPYGHWKQLGVPKSGEPIAMIAISYDHKERTNAIFAQYP